MFSAPLMAHQLWYVWFVKFKSPIMVRWGVMVLYYIYKISINCEYTPIRSLAHEMSRWAPQFMISGFKAGGWYYMFIWDKRKMCGFRSDWGPCFFRLRLTLHIRPIPITDPVSTDELGNFTPQSSARNVERGSWEIYAFLIGFCRQHYDFGFA